VIARAMIGTVRIYQILVSPLLPPSCRFVPSCSQYMIDAIREHGVFTGVWLGTKRLLRCQPLCKGGIDFVEPRQ
jgi:putative membrane protein insertion efficiency factor